MALVNITINLIKIIDTENIIKLSIEKICQILGNKDKNASKLPVGANANQKAKKQHL
jgi:hypothetical protein